ncbi:hypothetical protein H6F72_27420 [Trichocoleus sp. FACHB-46]|nr:hypothetical protein [Trichocoleus sp. FACHB-46]
MSQQTFLKVPFVWQEPKPLLEVPPRLIFEPVKAKHGNQLVLVVARIMALSMDASDQKRASDNDPLQRSGVAQRANDLDRNQYFPMSQIVGQ